MKKRILKIVLYIVFILLLLGMFIFSTMQTMEFRMNKEEAMKQKTIADESLRMLYDFLDSSTTSQMMQFLKLEIDSLKNELKIKDSIIANCKNQ